jgi:hypothetical protein
VRPDKQTGMDEGTKMARGRSERTPARLLVTVIVVVGAIVAAVWGLVALVQALV